MPLARKPTILVRCGPTKTTSSTSPIRDRVDDDTRLDALAACDVLVLPSVGEAFGIVYLEAWAYAKPVIGANIEAVASVIDHGVNGFLVDPRRPAELAARLRELVAQPGLAQSLGAAGRAKLARRFTMARIADVVEGTYGRVLRRKIL